MQWLRLEIFLIKPFQNFARTILFEIFKYLFLLSSIRTSNFHQISDPAGFADFKESFLNFNFLGSQGLMMPIGPLCWANF